jgi:hypothetical protein
MCFGLFAAHIGVNSLEGHNRLADDWSRRNGRYIYER